ncbi:unnamed protein product [Camellia sinensis]
MLKPKKSAAANFGASCLLVKGWKGTSWSFPRGKKNKDEEDHACAVREVLEETGFDVSKFLNKDDYIEMIFGQQRVRLYIIAGVKDDTAFAPLIKKEISEKNKLTVIAEWLEIAWQRLDEIQPANEDVISRGTTGLKLYMAAPFLVSLKAWILAHKPPVAPKSDLPLKVVYSEEFKPEALVESGVAHQKDNSVVKMGLEEAHRGISVWKATNNSTGSSSMITETQLTKPVVVDAHFSDTGPGKSFRDFRILLNSIYGLFFMLPLVVVLVILWVRIRLPE